MIEFILIAIICFLGTNYAMPRSIKNLEKNGYVARDMYKLDKRLIPTNAGIIILFTSLIGIALFPLLIRFLKYFTSMQLTIYNLSESHLAILLVVSIYSIYGLVDDLVNIGRKMKFILPPIFSFPLIGIIKVSEIWVPFFGTISLDSEVINGVFADDIFRVIIIPIYVMVVANLVNMHSGYNGLQSGLSVIVIVTLVIKSYKDGIIDNIIPAAAFLGSFIAFYRYNRYPSRVFEGNIGSLMFGSLIGSIIVLQNYWWFGFFILIPHTLNFLLWVFWLINMKLQPDIYLDSTGKHVKFGTVNEDGILSVPNNLTLKWVPNYYFNLSEGNSTHLVHFFTILFCATGLILF